MKVNLYKTVYDHLISKGAPEQLAKEAAHIIATDEDRMVDGDLQRSPQQQAIISESHVYLIHDWVKHE